MSVKISELPILSSLADNDIVAGVDVSGNVTSKIEMATLKNYIDTNTQYTAGTNIDITNNVVSAPNVYTKTETDELLEEKDEQIEELQSEVDSLSTIFNAFPTESDEDESMTLDGTAEVKFKKFDLKGNTSQTTYSGKNLLEPKMATASRNGITCTNNGNGSFTLNGTATATADFRLDQSQRTGEDNLKSYNGTYTISCNELINGIQLVVMQNTTWDMLGKMANNNTPVTFTANKDNCFIYVYVASGITLNNLIIRPMVEKGSSATSYEPFVGGTSSPNPSYPQPVNVVSGDNTINVVGKNLCKIEAHTYQDLSRAPSVGQPLPLFNTNGTIKIKIDLSTFDKTKAYTVSARNDITNLRCFYCDSNDLYITAESTSNPRTLSIPTNASILYIFIKISNVTDLTPIPLNDYELQLELGNTASTYEPYQGNTYNIDLGVENLWDISKLQSGYLNQSGSYPTTNPSFPNARYRSVYLYKGQSITTYKSTLYGDFRIRYIDVDTNLIVGTVTTGDNGGYCSSNVSYQGSFNNGTITALKDVILGLFDYGGNLAEATITYGTKIQAISPTPIELCKIGNYQDYFYKDSGKWYLHKEIGKVVLNGSESWTYALQSDVSRFDITIPNAMSGSATNNPILSTHFKTEFALVDKRIFLSGYGNTIAIMDNDFSNKNDFKNWLSSNNVTCYYGYTTPTNTEITYQPLIDQLNLLEKAMSKDGQTNISQVSNDKPFILDVTAIKSLQNILDRIELLES